MAKMTTSQMHKLIREAEDRLRGLAFNQGVDDWHRWRHYKGGVYEVDGYDIDTDDGGIRVRYHRIDGPGYTVAAAEHLVSFSRPIAEWFETVEVDGMAVPRFQSVTEVKRWETPQEMEQRRGY